jgi:hypothetical protein
MYVNWDLWVVNNRSYPVSLSIANDSSGIRNINYNYTQGKYPIVFNTSVVRKDHEESGQLILNPGEKRFFAIRYEVENAYMAPIVEGRYQFFERIGMDSSTYLIDSIFVNMYQFPDDSMKEIATAKELDGVSPGALTKYYSDTIFLYRDSIKSTTRYFEWKSAK